MAGGETVEGEEGREVEGGKKRKQRKGLLGMLFFLNQGGAI